MTLTVNLPVLTLGKRRVLQDINLAFQAGQVTVIMGPNGAGKTSLMRVLAGIAGEGAMLDGVALAKLNPQQRARQIGYLPQGTNPAWNVTARELVGLGRLPHRIRFAAATQADHSAIEAALAATDSAHLADRTLEAMSGGEKARVLLARVLAGEPRWILADEPIASLDPAHRLDMLALLRAQAVHGIGIITVLHDLTLSAQLADRIVLLSDGYILADGPPEAVLTPPLLARAYGITAEIDHTQEGQLRITPIGTL
jgi:iron complex transport system ATP-binding protein